MPRVAELPAAVAESSGIGAPERQAPLSNGLVGDPLQSAGAARETVQRALAIDDALSEAHNANMFVQGYYYCSWTEAEDSARRAVVLNPTNIVALLWGASVLSIVGERDEATEWFERARLLDPLSPYVGALAGFVLLLQFRDEEAMNTSGRPSCRFRTTRWPCISEGPPTYAAESTARRSRY